MCCVIKCIICVISQKAQPHKTPKEHQKCFGKLNPCVDIHVPGNTDFKHIVQKLNRVALPPPIVLEDVKQGLVAVRFPDNDHLFTLGLNQTSNRFCTGELAGQ